MASRRYSRGVIGEPRYSRGVSPVLRGVCANLLWKRSKAALSYSTAPHIQICMTLQLGSPFRGSCQPQAD